jgi:ATP-binding cassette subfamily F protein 3
VRDDLSARLAEVHSRLSDIEAESGPARAAALLSGVLVDEIYDAILILYRLGIL